MPAACGIINLTLCSSFVASVWYLETTRELYSQSSDSMFIIDLDCNITDCNGAALHLFKAKSRADLVQDMTLYDLVQVDKIEDVKSHLKTMFSQGLPTLRFDTEIITLKNKILNGTCQDRAA